MSDTAVAAFVVTCDNEENVCLIDLWKAPELRCRLTDNEAPVAPGTVLCELGLLDAVDAVCCNLTRVLLEPAGDGGMVEILRATRDDEVVGREVEVVDTEISNEVLATDSIDATGVPLVGTARGRDPAETLKAGINDDMEDRSLDVNVLNDEEVLMNGANEVKFLLTVCTGS